VVMSVPEDTGDTLDLRGQTTDEALPRVEEFIDHASRSGRVRVRLIHGKGTGVQRKRVRAVLDRLDYVLDYTNPPENRGGFGATLVRLDLLRR
nr:Smr/MutS family protein [Polyangiaceae bacterium]